jgi:hypothetical protein
VFWVTVHGFLQRVNGTVQRATARLSHQVLFGCKVAVETSVGETRGFHQVGNADTVEPAFTKQLRCNLNNPLPIQGGLLSGDSHLLDPLAQKKLEDSPLTL